MRSGAAGDPRASVRSFSLAGEIARVSTWSDALPAPRRSPFTELRVMVDRKRLKSFFDVAFTLKVVNGEPVVRQGVQ